MGPHVEKQNYFIKSELEQRIIAIPRDEAIERGHALRRLCSKVVFYTDKGMSSGMKTGLRYCQIHQIPYEMRNVGPYFHHPREFVDAILGDDQDYARYFIGTKLPEAEEDLE